MNDRRFTALTERLLRGGVAPRHARRAVQELRAHHADVVAELQASGLAPAQSEAAAAERVGPDEAFVRDMLARPELRSWAYRRPFVAFTLLPLLAFVGLAVLSVALTIGTVDAAWHLRALLSPSLTQTLHWLANALFAVALWLAPLAAGGVACVLAARQRIAARWAIAAVLLVGLLAAHVNGRLDLRAPPLGSISMGIGVSWPVPAPEVARRAGIFILAVLLPYFWWLRSHAATGARAAP